MLYVVPFLVTVLAILALRKYAEPMGLTVEPGGYRAHKVLTPLVGGVGMFLGFTSGLLLIDGAWVLWICMFVVVLAGVWDDIHELSTSARFLAQIVVAAIMIYWGDVVLFDLGYLVSDESLFYLGRWAVALTLFGSVGLMNAINMSDGMDGLAGGLTFVSASTILLAALYEGMTQSVIVLGIFLAVIAAFLLFNIRFSSDKPARVFMGDSGSMLLGLVLAWYVIKHTQAQDQLFSPAVALWIVALFLFDAVGVLFRRVFQGKSPFGADRSHYHHYLLALGFSVNQTLLISLSVAVVLAVVGLAAYHAGVPDRLIFYGFLLLFLIYLVAMEATQRKYKI